MAIQSPELVTHGITATTPKNILLGAGTVFKNLTWDKSASKWKFDKVLGATSGGSKFEFKNSYKNIDADGAHVKVKGLTLKTGQTATLETSIIDITPEILKLAINAEEKASDATGFKELVPKAQVDETDYLTNISYVGRTAEGKPIIIIMGNALCTEGLSLEGKNKDNSVLKVKFESYGDLTGDLKTLPVRIIYPNEL